MKAPQADQILGERYRLVRPLGSGGFGAVWHAEHLALHSPVAIKVLDPIALGDSDILQRFLREARAAAALRSAHVVQIIDYGVEGGTPYIAMELLEGESLEQRLEKVGHLSVAETERLVRHMARAVQRAHEAGIVHRDLKPGNIFIVPDDEDEIVKVLDFGVAKATNFALGRSLVVGATPAGALLGTPHYMSPEQAEGMRNLDFRTDFWSMGVIAYECLLGQLPFDGEALGALLTAICRGSPPVPSEHGAVPAGFDAWFARACARKPEERFDSAKQMAAAFSRLCEPLRAPAPLAAAALAATAAAALTATERNPSRASPDAGHRAASRSRTLRGLNGVLATAAPPARALSALGAAFSDLRMLTLFSGGLGLLAALVVWRGCLATAAPERDISGLTALSPTRDLAAPKPAHAARVEASAPANPAASTPTPAAAVSHEPTPSASRAPLRGGRVAPASAVSLAPAALPAAQPSEKVASPPPSDAPASRPSESGALELRPSRGDVADSEEALPPRSSSQRAPRVRATSASQAGARPGEPAASKDCEPPWYVGPDGIQRVKRACL